MFTIYVLFPHFNFMKPQLVDRAPLDSLLKEYEGYPSSFIETGAGKVGAGLAEFEPPMFLHLNLGGIFFFLQSKKRK